MLTVLGAIYTAYPALQGRLRAPITRALVGGLAAGLILAASIALVGSLLLALAVLSITGRTGPAFAGALVAAAQLALAAFEVGALAGILAGLASAAERRPGAGWRRNLVLAVLWLGLLSGAVTAYALRPSLLVPAGLDILGFSVVVGVLVQPPPLGPGQRLVLALGLPAGFLLLAVVARLTSAGGANVAVVLVVSALVVLSVTCAIAVPVFVVCRPPPPTVREASARRFLASAGAGLLVAIAVVEVNARAIHGGSLLGYLALGIAPLLTALGGDARLLLHTPRARFTTSGPAVRVVWGVAFRRFRRGALVGAVFAFEQAVLSAVVGLLVPGAVVVPPVVVAAAAVAGFTIAWALALGVLKCRGPVRDREAGADGRRTLRGARDRHGGRRRLPRRLPDAAAADRAVMPAEGLSATERRGRIAGRPGRRHPGA